MGCGQGRGDGCGPCCNQGRDWGGQGLDCGLDRGLGCGTEVADRAALPAHRSRPVTLWRTKMTESVEEYHARVQKLRAELYAARRRRAVDEVEEARSEEHTSELQSREKLV